MKKKGNTSPILTIGLQLISSAQILIYLANIVRFGNDDLDIFSIVICIIAVVLAVIGVVFAVLNLIRQRKKGQVLTDEYSTKIMQKCGSICFAINMFMVFIMFLVFQMVCLANESFEGSINEFFDIRIVFSIIAFIQVFNVFLFSLLFYIYNKKGEVQ